MIPSIIIFLIVLSIVVLIHELGHFVAAKLVGIKVEEFGFGYPPRAVGKKIGETIYSLNWLPFGGFVRMFGEEEGQMDSKQKLSAKLSKRAFYHKSKRQRSLVILAGVAMNLLLGVFCFSLIYSTVGIPQEVDYITVQGIAANSPAQAAGVSEGDRVLAIDGIAMDQTSDFVDYLKDKKGVQVTVTLERDHKTLQIPVTPRTSYPPEEGAVGVLVSNYDNVFYPAWQMPFRGVWVGVQETYAWTKMMLEGLGTMVSGIFKGATPEVTGPVGIYQITSTVAEQGILPLIKFIGILSINLAVVNILPLPALDGGRFVFIMIEGIIGRKIKPAIEAYINMAGMAVLIGLMVLVTIGDVIRLIRG
ncbi:RIP metalloprotease RseP [Candidatus Beckwithbacteria bacterium]|nr:RIP metalloprotease RseP [Candidatus Beckwithbacteria bacterium]